jgi:hypothetical protein
MYWGDLKNDERVDSTRLILAFAWRKMPFRHNFRRLIVIPMPTGLTTAVSDGLPSAPTPTVRGSMVVIPSNFALLCIH